MKKRILASTLALTLALAMTHTAFAADDTTSTGSVVFDNGLEDGGVSLFTEPMADSAELDNLATQLKDFAQYIPNDTDWTDEAFLEFVVDQEITPEIQNIKDNYGTGSSFSFGTLNPITAPLNTAIKSSANDSYVDVVVFDTNFDSEHYMYDQSNAGWTLKLSRDDFVDVNDETEANKLDATLNFTMQTDSKEEPNARTFRGNVPEFSTGGKNYSGAIGNEARTVSEGSLGYVATRFDAELILSDRPAEGEYQSTLTWTLEQGPINGAKAIEE